MAYDAHLQQAIASARKIITDRETQMDAVNRACNQKREVLLAMLKGLGERIDALQTNAGELSQAAELCRGHLDTALTAHAEALTGAEQHRTQALAELERLHTDAVAVLTEQHLARTGAFTAQLQEIEQKQRDILAAVTNLQHDFDATTDRLALIQQEREQQLKLMRHGRYQDAVKRLAELEARAAKQAAEAATRPEPLPPAPEAHDDRPRVCDACRKIAQPWVLAGTRTVLCVDCARQHRL